MTLGNFKQVVDRHGHLLGAKVLKEVAEVVHSNLGKRGSDQANSFNPLLIKTKFFKNFKNSS